MCKYVIVDLEMCNVPRGIKRDIFKSSSELIQIGAVSLDDSFNLERSFMTYVFPEFGSIDSYIKKLTGITNNDTRNAPKSKEALEKFTEWIPYDAKMVAWSNNDEKQIEKEIVGKNLSMRRLEDMMGTWIDCQELFGDKLNTKKKYKLSEALSIANVDYEYGAHDALVDAKNTAKLFAKIQREEKFELSPYYVREEDLDCYLCRSNSGLLSQYVYA